MELLPRLLAANNDLDVDRRQFVLGAAPPATSPPRGKNLWIALYSIHYYTVIIILSLKLGHLQYYY